MEAAAVPHEHHGPPPANRSSRVDPALLGMLLFIISEVMVFGAFFTAYFFIRVVQGAGNRRGLQAGILTTFLLGCTFLFIQINEYVHLGFSPQDSAQGTIFYGLTGLHGAHVFVGLTLLLFVNIRAFRGHFTATEHRGIEVPGIYWHFVDVMWIVVYLTVYIL
jgi:cytochrome c oxidase subunit III